MPQQVWPLLPPLPHIGPARHGIVRHVPLQYVPAPHWMLHPPQLLGSFVGSTHVSPQQSRPLPHDASHPLPALLLLELVLEADVVLELELVALEALELDVPVLWLEWLGLELPAELPLLTVPV